MPLHVQIDTIEHSLQTHRGQIGADVRGLGRKFRARLTSPGTLLAAVAVGVVVEQGIRRRTWSLVSLFQGLSVANSLFATLMPLLKSSDAPRNP